MKDYEKVLEKVFEVLPRIQAGQINKVNAPGGVFNDEEEKNTGGGVSINSAERAPLLDNDNVMISHIAGTIEVDE